MVLQNRLIYLYTFGCQMNENDSELIRAILTDAGFSITDTKEEASIFLLNTCSVRDSAERKVFNLCKLLRHQLGDDICIGMLGCMVTCHQEDLIQKKTGIDFTVGPANYRELPLIINNALSESAKKQAIFDLDSLENYKDLYPLRKEGSNAWVAITRGCNNYCSYCVVPYTRGPERSRDLENILEEIYGLVEAGFKQVTLLGQNVNSYMAQGFNFSDLIQKISDIQGLKRIRFTSPNPKDFDLKLIKIISERDNICNHIHLPLQSGSSSILEKMNRPYTKEKYLSLVQDIRNEIPDMVFTTDIIVGFPTESEEDFQHTVDVMNAVEYDASFIFKYSPRPHTKASELYSDDVAESDKTKRIVMLNEIQETLSLKKNRAYIGQKHQVLIEQMSTSKDPNSSQGRNDGNKRVILPSDSYSVGDIIACTITDATPHVLKGIYSPSDSVSYSK